MSILIECNIDPNSSIMYTIVYDIYTYTSVDTYVASLLHTFRDSLHVDAQNENDIVHYCCL